MTLFVAILATVVGQTCMERTLACLRPVHEDLDGCLERCAAAFELERRLGECQRAERRCQIRHFMSCFEGPIPHGELCWRIGDKGKKNCQPWARPECVEFDYDGDGAVSLYDYMHWHPGFTAPLRKHRDEGDGQ